VALADTTDVDLRPWRVAAVALVPAAFVVNRMPIDVVPRCPLRSITGVPCPMCGSTRGVIAAMHGHLGHALELNPASLLVIALAALLVLGWTLGWRVERVRIPVWCVVAVFAVLWIYQLFKYATGRPL
jgi:Protein of unknown function (DUF2752)